MKEGPSTETVYLREKLYVLRDVFKYYAVPKEDTYLTRRQRGELEGPAENRYRLRPENPVRTGTDDIASRLGLYTAASFSTDLLAKKKPYDINHS